MNKVIELLKKYEAVTLDDFEEDVDDDGFYHIYFKGKKISSKEAKLIMEAFDLEVLEND